MRTVENEAANDDSENGKENVSHAHGKRVRRMRERFTPSTPTPPPPVNNDDDDNDNDDHNNDNNDDDVDNDGDARHEKVTTFVGKQPNIKRIRRVRQRFTPSTPTPVPRDDDDDADDDDENDADRDDNDDDSARKSTRKPSTRRRHTDAAQHLHRYASQTQAGREMANERRRQAYAARLAAVDIADERAAAADDERDDDDDVQARLHADDVDGSKGTADGNSDDDVPPQRRQQRANNTAASIVAQEDNGDVRRRLSSALGETWPDAPSEATKRRAYESFMAAQRAAMTRESACLSCAQRLLPVDAVLLPLDFAGFAVLKPSELQAPIEAHYENATPQNRLPHGLMMHAAAMTNASGQSCCFRSTARRLSSLRRTRTLREQSVYKC